MQSVSITTTKARVNCTDSVYIYISYTYLHLIHRSGIVSRIVILKISKIKISIFTIYVLSSSLLVSSFILNITFVLILKVICHYPESSELYLVLFTEYFSLRSTHIYLFNAYKHSLSVLLVNESDTKSLNP